MATRHACHPDGTACHAHPTPVTMNEINDLRKKVHALRLELKQLQQDHARLEHQRLLGHVISALTSGSVGFALGVWFTLFFWRTTP